MLRRNAKDGLPSQLSVGESACRDNTKSCRLSRSSLKGPNPDFETFVKDYNDRQTAGVVYHLLSVLHVLCDILAGY